MGNIDGFKCLIQVTVLLSHRCLEHRFRTVFASRRRASGRDSGYPGWWEGTRNHAYIPMIVCTVLCWIRQLVNIAECILGTLEASVGAHALVVGLPVEVFLFSFLPTLRPFPVHIGPINDHIITVLLLQLLQLAQQECAGHPTAGQIC